MAFKTFAPGVLTSSDVNTFLMRQAVITCTSSTRPSSPSEGMFIYETDTDNLAKYNGSSWVYQGKYDYSFTPTLSGSGWTFKGYTAYSKVAQIGDMCHYIGYILWDGTGSQTAGSGSILVDLPIESATGPTAYTRLAQRGVFAMSDDSANAQYIGFARTNSTTELFLGAGDINSAHDPSLADTGLNSTSLGSGIACPTDANDRWYWSLWYEV